MPKLIILAIYLISLFTFAAGPKGNVVSSTTTDTYALDNENIPKISGHLTQELLSELNSLYIKKPYSHIIAENISGGVQAPAIEIENFIFDRNISVIFSGYCHSACANYILPAAKIKIVMPNTKFGWHGCSAKPASTQAEIEAIERFFDSETLATMKQEEASFYQKVGVNQAICTCGMDESTKTPMFYYTPKDLYKFGIRDFFILQEEKDWLKNYQAYSKTYSMTEACSTKQ